MYIVMLILRCILGIEGVGYRGLRLAVCGRATPTWVPGQGGRASSVALEYWSCEQAVPDTMAARASTACTPFFRPPLQAVQSGGRRFGRVMVGGD